MTQKLSERLKVESQTYGVKYYWDDVIAEIEQLEQELEYFNCMEIAEVKKECDEYKQALELACDAMFMHTPDQIKDLWQTKPEYWLEQARQTYRLINCRAYDKEGNYE